MLIRSLDFLLHHPCYLPQLLQLLHNLHRALPANLLASAICTVCWNFDACQSYPIHNPLSFHPRPNLSNHFQHHYLDQSHLAFNYKAFTNFFPFKDVNWKPITFFLIKKSFKLFKEALNLIFQYSFQHHFHFYQLQISNSFHLFLY